MISKRFSVKKLSGGEKFVYPFLETGFELVHSVLLKLQFATLQHKHVSAPELLGFLLRLCFGGGGPLLIVVKVLLTFNDSANEIPVMGNNQQCPVV